ncbi:hypothetical protein GCM10011374_40080 [Kocuria dechangensis]|uniref:Uncharacterized protein n=1 Tax=Kocuria dechangensis TaxID=1176249 RepID=A0A917H8V8_9MICC|nr:hypothetical protein [Kocuria dechangensis]GGG71381.1 hypothetical protein GCM10011374_40080 [Kocuria dechangensis]
MTPTVGDTTIPTRLLPATLRPVPATAPYVLGAYTATEEAYPGADPVQSVELVLGGTVVAVATEGDGDPAQLRTLGATEQERQEREEALEAWIGDFTRAGLVYREVIGGQLFEVDYDRELVATALLGEAELTAMFAHQTDRFYAVSRTAAARQEFQALIGSSTLTDEQVREQLDGHSVGVVFWSPAQHAWIS